MGEMIHSPLITLSSDFGSGNVGCAAMEGVIFGICPEAKVIHWCHAIPGFDIKDGARQLEGVACLRQGFHVCVVDPGVGTRRRGIAVQTGRGDVLIGPDNGVLRPAAELLGGIVVAVELTNEKYQRTPVSPIFHGRDIFAPAAAHLARGVELRELGASVELAMLTPSPYAEARWEGPRLHCEVIHINENGSLFLNVRAEEFQKNLKRGEGVEIIFGTKKILLSYCETFGSVPKGEALILNDDFGRAQASVNQGNFAFTFGVKRGQKLLIQKRTALREET